MTEFSRILTAEEMNQFTHESFSMSDAPSYRKGAGPQVCENCKYAAAGNRCDKYDFTFDPTFTCDAFAVDRDSMSEPVQFVDHFQYKPGEPFRIMPLGEFKRGDRKIAITRADLEQMAGNFSAGRPRWKIPIYPGHPTEKNPDPPALGYATKLEVRGDGLYAYPEFDDGKQKKIAGYRYNSPGVLWKKNGSEYADDQGAKHDNVIDHIALTNRPFFGEKTALFSADPVIVEEFQDYGKHKLATVMGIIKSALAQITSFAESADLDDDDGPTTQQEESLKDKRPAVEATKGQPVDVTDSGTYGARTYPDNYREFTADQRKAFAAKGWARPDGSYPIEHEGDLQNAVSAWGRGGATPEDKAHIIKRARALGATDKLPADWTGSTKEKEKMSDNGTNTTGTTAKTVETFAISPDEYAALKAKASRAEELEAKASKTDEFAERLAKAEAALAEQTKSERVRKIERKLEKFTALPEKASKMAETFADLKDKDADLYKTVFDWIETMSGQLDAAQPFLLRQIASGAGQSAKNGTFEAVIDGIVKEKFAGDMSHYAEAYSLAATQRPDLAEKYMASAAKRNEETVA